MRKIGEWFRPGMTRPNWKSRIFDRINYRDRNPAGFLGFGLTFLLLISGCIPVTGSASVTTAAAVATDVPAAACTLEPLVIPTPLSEIPGYAMLDSSIGLHITGNAREINPVSYRLKVSGLVDSPLELTLDELRCLPQVSDDPPLVCEGYFTDKATWTGAALNRVLDMAGVQPEADSVVLVSADGYKVNLSLKEAKDEQNILAYEVNGETLPILHGFPLRAVIPMKYGNSWVKWLVEIQVE